MIAPCELKEFMTKQIHPSDSSRTCGAEQGTGQETWLLPLPLTDVLCGLDKGLPSPCLSFP